MQLVAKDIEMIPDVSVIIPTHNRLALLLEPLKSVENQKFDGKFEVIVVDEGSSDETVKTIKIHYPYVHLKQLVNEQYEAIVKPKLKS